MEKSFDGYLYAILSGFFYGVIPILVVSIAKNEIATNAGSIMIRYAITSVMLLPFALRLNKIKRVELEQVFEIIVAGIAMAVTAIGMYTSYYWLPAGIGMAISYLYPLLILPANAFLYHKKLTTKIVAVEIIAFIGILLLCDYTILPTGAWKGMIFALLSALGYAAYILWQEKRNLGRIHPIVYTEILSITCACWLACFNLATGQFYIKISVQGLLLFAILGVVGALATATQFIAVKRIGSIFTSILGTLELVVCCLGSAFVLEEPFSTRSISGMGMILGTVIILTARPIQSSEEF